MNLTNKDPPHDLPPPTTLEYYDISTTHEAPVPEFIDKIYVGIEYSDQLRLTHSNPVPIISKLELAMVPNADVEKS